MAQFLKKELELPLERAQPPGLVLRPELVLMQALEQMLELERAPVLVRMQVLASRLERPLTQELARQVRQEHLEQAESTPEPVQLLAPLLVVLFPKMEQQPVLEPEQA